MIINSINTESITPIEYNHMHDQTIIFRKYRENFDFGLTVDQYYINKEAKDKKTNYNTQYTLSDTQSLSTLIELKIPYTKKVTEEFTSTVKFNGDFLMTSGSAASALSADFVDSSLFSNLSSQFFFTFTLTSISLTNSTDIDTLSGNTLPFEDRVIVSTTSADNTYYLAAVSGTDTTAIFLPLSTVSTSIPTFRFNIENNKLTLSNVTPELSSRDGRFCNHGGELSLSGIDNFFSSAALLSTCIFDINRFELTKNYKTLPNSFVKYASSFNTDTVDLNTTTVTEHISNNYFVYSNNYNFFTEKINNTNTVHADLFPLKNQRYTNITQKIITLIPNQAI